MNETDDRLTGDPVWELFAASARHSTQGVRRPRIRWWLVVVGLTAVGWLLSPFLGVVVPCLTVAAPDLRKGRKLARSMPDKVGGAICARFTYAWGAWKFAVAAFVMMYLTMVVLIPTMKRGDEGAWPCLAALLLAIAGFILSAALTASGLISAYRSEMRVWIGEGVNQARTLLMGMLIVVFTFAVLAPLAVWLSVLPGGETSPLFAALLLSLFGCLFVGPLSILVALDILSRRVIANRPGKFGPKVPAVGKWNS